MPVVTKCGINLGVKVKFSAVIKTMSKLNYNVIASLSGVSNATVSRAFSNPEKVSKKTLEKVLSTSKSLGFTPSRLGASLRTGRSFNILVLVPDITNPYFSPMVRAIEKTANSRGYSVLLGDTLDSPEREKSYGKMLQSKQADGIIINSQRLPFDLDFGKPLPPIVSASELSEYEDIYRVGVDNIAIGKLATAHLLELGHTRIAVVSGNKEKQSSYQRLEGYKQALHEARISYDPKLVYYADYSIETAAQVTEQLVSEIPDISAIFSFGDLMSMGILHMLKKLNYQVPQQISVISVDNISLAPYCNPPLTTIAQPLNAIGHQCINTLIDLIEKKVPENKLTLLPHELVCRESTARFEPR